MNVIHLKAEPDPRGFRIVLSWTNPDFSGFRGVKILRRESTYPLIPKDIGSKVEIYDFSSAMAGQHIQYVDKGLKGETIYYYAVAAYDDTRYFPAFTSTMATTAYESAVRLYKNLPGLYKNYDTVLPPDVPDLEEVDRGKGQLRRLMDMFGLNFDLIRSFAGGMRNFSDITQIDSKLLPLLAQWINWQHNFTLSPAKQRSEIRFAPHYFRTTGIAPNLRANLNRLTSWNAQIKEFFHNVFLSNNPEQLTIWEKERHNTVWQSSNLVTLDIAYEGKMSAIEDEQGRSCLFYHARQSAPQPRTQQSNTVNRDRWLLWYKIYDTGQWLPAHPIPLKSKINKYPAVFQKSDKNFWLFWTEYNEFSGKNIPRMRLNLFSFGRSARPVQVEGTQRGSFSFTDGDTFEITVNNGPKRNVTLRNEHFHDIANVSSKEIAAFLNSEIPGVDVRLSDEGTLVFTTFETGSASTIEIHSCPVASEIGLTAHSVQGSNANIAELIGSQSQSFSLDGTKLIICADNYGEKAISFTSESTAAEVAEAINREIPGIAHDQGGSIRLTSSNPSEASFVAVDVDESTAAQELGFSAPVPSVQPPIYESEPAAFEDNTGNVWLFWNSQRTGMWKIWYSRFSGTNWENPRQLTHGLLADREPTAVFDPDAGRIWVFWSRRKSNGLWNIFYRSTTNLDFDTHTDADWTGEQELEPIPTGYENKEPVAVVNGTDSVELYFSSNRTDGWNIWSKTITPSSQGTEGQITTGQFTQKTPMVLNIGNQNVRLWFRSNETQIYTSSLYPDARTRDARYSGSTTVDMNNVTKRSLKGNINDVQFREIVLILGIHIVGAVLGANHTMDFFGV